MAFKQQRPKLFTQIVLALAGLGAIAPGCIAFATGLPSQAALTVQAQPSAVQSLTASHE